MKDRKEKSEVRNQKSEDRKLLPRSVHALAVAAVLLLPWCSIVIADDLAVLCADRAAIERVYHEHRLGTKPPFEQALPPATLERLVRDDLRKEAALKQAYGIEVTPAMLDAEVQRINSTTRAPEMLAELKAALGNDPARFARTVARPIIVERLLRERFDNDDKLHAAPRREADSIRNQLLAVKDTGVEKRLTILKGSQAGSFNETTWQLMPRPEAGKSEAPNPKLETMSGPTKATVSAGTFTIEATAQLTQTLASPATEHKEQKFYFADLPGELQRVLRAQLRQPGDVSAVVEMPGGFLLYLLKSKTADAMTVAALSIPKRSYEDWLSNQKE